ncbi:MAG: hypothetical protein Q4C42_00600 [Clostridia bacterium]|nr:hypothetical protein [Clostridia bacterium]
MEKSARNSWNTFAILGVCLSLTSMASLINIIISLGVNGYAYYSCKNGTKQGRKLSIIGMVLTVVSAFMSYSSGFLLYFVISFILISLLISIVIFGIVEGILYYNDMKNSATDKSDADWVRRTGKLLFLIYPLGWSKTKMIVVNSADGTPHYVEKTKATFGDRAYYTASEISWKEVRRYAEESPNAEIKLKFAEVDADNWWKFTNNR